MIWKPNASSSKTSGCRWPIWWEPSTSQRCVKPERFWRVALIADYRAIGEEKVDFFPAAYAARLDGLLPAVGQRVVPGYRRFLARRSQPSPSTKPPNWTCARSAAWVSTAWARMAGSISSPSRSTTTRRWATTSPAIACCRTRRGSASPTPRTTTRAATSPACWSASWCAWQTACARAIRRRSTASAPPTRRTCSTASPISKRAVSPSKPR